MELESRFRYIISRVTPAVKINGYRKRKTDFYVHESGNWGIINFQKSTTNTSERLIFTVNLGIASSRLLHFFSVKHPESGPSILDCHWQMRLGELIEGNDMWWSIAIGESIDQLGERLLNHIVNLAIPEIVKYLDDYALRDLWLSGYSPSLTKFQRLMYLSVFLKELGPRELLEPTLKELKRISIGKPSSFTADIHIEKLMKNQIV